MNILALTFGGEQAPSTHYRILQYGPLLAAHGHTMQWTRADEFTDWDRLSGADVVILQKKILDKKAWCNLRRRARRIVYDLDDAIWTRPGRPHGWWTGWKLERRLRRMAAEADAVTVANHVLAGALCQFGAKPTVIPMALDPKIWKPNPGRPDTPFTIGWSGGPGNLPYLESVYPQLREAASATPALSLEILCGAPPADPGFPWRHHPYQPGIEPGIVSRFHLGLLPLPDGAFERAKSPIKALQYAACGVGTLAAPVGAVGEMVLDGRTGRLAHCSGWGPILREILSDPTAWAETGRQARQHFEQHHSLPAVFPFWLQPLAGHPDETAAHPPSGAR
jgi:glycosyltransferase involved in cell wall biosynthesis